MVKCHGLEIYAWFIPPHFSIAKILYTEKHIHRFVCVVFNNECELPFAIENGIFDSNMVLPLLQKRDTRKFVVVVVVISIARHMFHCSRLHKFFVPFDSNRKQIYAYVRTKPNAHEIQIYCDGLFINRMPNVYIYYCYMRSIRYMCTIYSIFFSLKKKK